MKKDRRLTVREIVGDGRRLGHSAEMDPIIRYRDQKCVIGYYDSLMGSLFVIEGRIKPFVYLFYKEGVLRGRGSYGLTRIDDYHQEKFDTAINLIEKEGQILDKPAWEKMLLKIGADAL